eukprot:4256573-Pyramimonas_sp.AAC.1
MAKVRGTYGQGPGVIWPRSGGHMAPGRVGGDRVVRSGAPPELLVWTVYGVPHRETRGRLVGTAGALRISDLPAYTARFALAARCCRSSSTVHPL